MSRINSLILQIIDECCQVLLTGHIVMSKLDETSTNDYMDWVLFNSLCHVRISIFLL